MSSTSDMRFTGVRGAAAALFIALWAGSWGSLAAQSGTTPAPSDPARDASARALFEEGVAFVEAGDLVQAEDRFRRALSLRDSPVIAYNLASTLVERGKLVEASESLRKLTRDPNVDVDLQQSATELLAQTTPRIGRLRVVVEGGAEGDAVTLDGQPLLAAQLDVDVPVDPGSHQLQLQRASNPLDTQTSEVTPGGAHAITLRATALSPQAVAEANIPQAPAPTPPPAATAKREDQSVFSTWWFWTGAAVLAGAAVATVVIAASDSDSGTAPPFRGDFDPPSLALEVAQ